MAREKDPQEVAAQQEKKNIQAEKRQLKNEQKAQKKEAKRRAKEIAKREDALDEDSESGGLATFLTTLFIVVLWLAVLGIVVKMDIGGFGSSVLTPVLKDVPVVNKILPGAILTETTDGESYYGYTSLKEAVDQIKALELQLDRAQNDIKTKDTELTTLKAEVLRLQAFEDRQVDFQRIRTEFYEEVIYAENGPGAEEYQKYYESMDPTTAEYLYKQVVTQSQKDKKIQEYVSTFSRMKPKAAAQIFETMSNDMNLVANILQGMTPDDRGAIMGAMTPEFAGKLAKIMNPQS